MYASFASAFPVLPVGHDATAHHAAFPRAMRKTLRLSKPKTIKLADNTAAYPEATDSRFHSSPDSYRVDRAFLLNLETAGEDGHDFQDEDNEFEGLTITEPMDEQALWHFCTGYDVL